MGFQNQPTEESQEIRTDTAYKFGLYCIVSWGCHHAFSKTWQILPGTVHIISVFQFTFTVGICNINLSFHHKLNMNWKENTKCHI